MEFNLDQGRNQSRRAKQEYVLDQKGEIGPKGTNPEYVLDQKVDVGAESNARVLLRSKKEVEQNRKARALLLMPDTKGRI